MSKNFTLIILVTLIIAVIVGLLSHLITKNILEKRIEEDTKELLFRNMDIAYGQCGELCAPNIPTFVNIINGTAQCLCIEINNGNPTSNGNIPT